MKLAFDLLCLDERDSPNLSELSAKSRIEIRSITNRRHFGLCGVIIPGATFPELNLEGRRIQNRIHGMGKFVPFHYVEILGKKKSYAFIGKSPAKYQSLITLLNQFIESTKFKILASFIDKQKTALIYGVYKQDKLTLIKNVPGLNKVCGPKEINLYQIALKRLMLDYYLYLEKNKRRGLIIAEARGEVEDLKLLEAFYNYQKSGIGKVAGRTLRQYVVDLLIIRKSQNHIGLQIADLVAYPLYDNFVPFHNCRNDHFVKKKTYESKILKVSVFP